MYRLKYRTKLRMGAVHATLMPAADSNKPVSIMVEIKPARSVETARYGVPCKPFDVLS
jgi:hypothetical protein